MPRPRTARSADLKTYSVYMTTAEAAAADDLARSLGCLNEKGEPSRSVLFLRLVREERKRLERRAKKSEKNGAVDH